MADGPAAFEQAVACFREGRLDTAEKLSSRLLKQWPGSFDALHLLGIIKLQTGKPGAAVGFFQSALKANPDSAQALGNLAMALSALHRDEEALSLLDRARALDSNSSHTLNGRGSLLLRLNRAAEALADFDRALAIDPTNAGIALNRGNALAQLNRLGEALAQYDAVLASQPQFAEAHYNRGKALFALGRAAEALTAFDRALARRPDYGKALFSRALALQALNRHREALAGFERLLAIEPDNADAHHNAALVRLTLGDYRRGFREYEWRWRRTGMPGLRKLGKPLWLGEYPLGRKTILLHAEQGMGDSIHFVRYAPLLASAGARVVLELPRELVSLFARLEGVAAVVPRGESLPPFDVHCPLGSLPCALGTEPSSIPSAVSYLKPSKGKLALWRERLANVSSPCVAIAWAGNASHPNDCNRSIRLPLIEPILSLDRINVVSVQRELREEHAKLPARVTHVGQELADFDDTGAVLALADLVIAVDTAVAHLAAALGRPTWILLPFCPDWRWMIEREDSPWYPTVRLFRQPAPGDWASVIRKVSEELGAVAARLERR
ncbi:MAG TPA: tetratricopeptide repeat protein [Xanthobacteraceae bacterium]|jgi:tetratricopeptide (TPR) repeat protein